ncbi:GNAT family N-acetyltransferase [Kibdelosporangium philippinense]|uniref:GNAT family N-acetyltransferase n=1 Tax=Kibdelosporangium philippinense TaxID=211113 RepID=A0ABS8ZL18_9PSEU|nr:GNAT family N-acetyltransferase [Kibdelosporangium philippinense]MCE7008169.1 GNAT family N-acetyltransferase [Kibdelosporangium philippinense]
MTTADTLRFSPLVADDDETVTEWLALLAESAEPSLSLESPPPCPVDMVGSLRHAPPDTSLEDWVVRRDGRVLASLRLALPAGAPMVRVDQLLVHPSVRRQGIGRTLYSYALERAAEHGREGITATVVEQLPDGPERDPGPSAFAAAVGAKRSESGAGVHQWLDLELNNPLADGVPALAEGYELVTWGTTTPEEYAIAVSKLELSLGGASLDIPDEQVETSYARRFEVMRVGRGRRAYHTGVVHTASGLLVGYTSISKTTGNPQHALQGMTVVHTTHRGHGLGIVIKLANLAQTLEHVPTLRMLETANAEGNAAMIAVNAAMGFRPDARWTTWTS